MSDASKPAGLILAGGKGRRIGGGKAERRLAGLRLIDHVRAFAESRCAALLLSVRGAGPDSDLEAISDTPDLVGPLAGILAGAEAVAARGQERMLVLPCDCPFLPDDLVERLAAALAANEGAGMAAASSAGRLHPAVALIRLDRIGDIRATACADHLRLMALFERMDGVRVEWSVRNTNAGPLDPFFNVNSEGDLAEADRLWGCRTLEI